MAKDSEDIIIKVKASHVKTLFPKDGDFEKSENNFGIVVWEVVDVEDGDPKVNVRNEITVKGSYINGINWKQIYIILAKQVEHPQYGLQYEMIYYVEDIDFTKVNNQKGFLRSFLNENQISALYEKFENPLQIIANHDKQALMSIKGIGDYISNRIIRDFEEKRDMSAVFAELDGMGLTTNFINKLIANYKSTTTVIHVVLHEPYRLIDDMDGVGFVTADKIAIAGGMPIGDKKRIKAFIEYYLNQEAEAGNSYITAKELNAAIFEQLGDPDDLLEFYDENDRSKNNLNEAIQELEADKVIHMEEAEKKGARRVYLYKLWDLEREIAYHLKRIMDAPSYFVFEDFDEKIKATEERQGFEFTEEQLEGIKLGLDSQVCLITGPAGCVDCDTEFFTGKGWKRIADYQEGNKVLQYNVDTGIASLTYPLQYIKLPCDHFWHFETKYGLNQTLSEEHRIPYYTRKNIFKETDILSIKEKQDSDGYGWEGRFITSFRYNEKGIDLTDDEIRIMVAVIADGSFTPHNTNLCRFHLKKERKKERLKLLAKNANIEIREAKSASEGYNDYYIYSPWRMKEFLPIWYKCSYHQLKIICDEVLYWDGHVSKTNNNKTRRSYSTTSKKSADFVQFAFSATGQRASVVIDDRIGDIKITDNKQYTMKSICYNVIATKRNLVGMCCDSRKDHTKTPIQKVSSLDGFKYCFTVPTSYLVLRRENNIFVTGNCGKTSLVTGILSVLSDYNFAQCCLSGKGAARLQEVTGQQGKTIHRLLGYNAEIGGFLYNQENPLPYDIIILDEISLVGGEIFRDLLRAIKPGTKFYMLGDPNQLEAIGSLNLAADMVNSKNIPTVALKQVHRQAKKSGILTTAYDVKDQIQLFDEWDFEGTEIRGELEDMVLEITTEKEEDRELVVKYFIKYFGSNLVERDPMKIQVLSPVKERGDASVFKLNRDIQEIVNPLKWQNYVHIHKRKDAAGNDFSFDIREGDKVMCIKNSYKMWIGEGDFETSIFNGWTGMVKGIKEGYVIVEFPLADYPMIYIPIKEVGEYLMLGYASTIHKMQGSDYPVIIGVVDFTTPPSMLTHQLVYTLLTRAKKLCVLVAQNKALRKAINTDFVSTKRTFLPEMLEYSKEELLEIANINLWDEVRESYKDIEARENEPEMVITAYTNRKVAREAENDEEEDSEENYEDEELNSEEFDSERVNSEEAIPLDI